MLGVRQDVERYGLHGGQTGANDLLSSRMLS